MPEVRLQKYLAQAGIASRRQSERLIIEGKISVNGRKVNILGSKINPRKDEVKVCGKAVERKKIIYIILNKPDGYLSTCKKGREKGETALDLVSVKERLYPVGRLDKNSSGLLLLTNDGDLALKLTHPRYEHEKEYEVEANKNLSGRDLKKMSEGLIIDGKKTLPARVEKSTPKKFKIILREGRKRQIRRMANVLGYQVKKLRRVRIGGLKLGNLPSGKWRYLTEEEINNLKNPR